MLRTIWRDNERYIAAYWEKFDSRYYVAGDSAHRDKDGYFWIMGRIDDVLNVAGHRLGTMEVESALVAHPRVAEAAVVGKPHEIKGESVFAFRCAPRAHARRATPAPSSRSCATGSPSSSAPIAKPDDIRFADNLPKTRSGKIMRRLLKAIARGEEITQDVSTLENPAILDQLRGTQARAGRRGPPRQRRPVLPEVAKAAKKREAQGTDSGPRAAPVPRRAARRRRRRCARNPPARPVRGRVGPHAGAAAQAASPPAPEAPLARSVQPEHHQPLLQPLGEAARTAQPHRCRRRGVHRAWPAARHGRKRHSAGAPAAAAARIE